MTNVRLYTGLVKVYHGIVIGLVNIPIIEIIQMAIATRNAGLTSFTMKMKLIKDMMTSISKTIKEEASRFSDIIATPVAVIPQMDDANPRIAVAVWFKV